MAEKETKEASHRNWREKAAISIQEYAELVGVHRNMAYKSVHAGDVATIRVGGRIRVSVPALLRKLEA